MDPAASPASGAASSVSPGRTAMIEDVRTLNPALSFDDLAALSAEELEQLYEADQAGRSLGREAILAAAREAGLPCSQQEVRRILAGLDRAGLVRVSRGRGGTRLTPAGRALCRRQTVEGGAEMV